jgi:hypothetical protein
MASAGVRLTLRFDLQAGLKDQGWSESYDLIYTTLPQAVANSTPVNNFINDRLNCLGTGVLLTSAKLTANPGGPIVPPLPRRATIQLTVPGYSFSTAASQAYNKALALYPADYGTTVLYWSLQTDPSVTPTYRRSLWIAGIPDACDTTASVLPVEGPWNTYFTKFTNDLQGQGSKLGTIPPIISIRSLDQSNANPFKPCNGYTFATNTYNVPAHGFANGQVIVAEGFRSKPGQTAPRGQYKCIVGDLNNIMLAGGSPINATVPPGGFRALVYVWNAVFSASMLGFSKRNKGRPSRLSVGRRRKANSLRA